MFTNSQTYQILTNDDKVCIPSLSSILIAVFSSQHEISHMLNGKTPENQDRNRVPWLKFL